MPAISKAQRALMAIAEKTPSKVQSKNKGILKMSKQQLSDFASTPGQGLPQKVSAKAVPVKAVVSKIKPVKKVAKKK